MTKLKQNGQLERLSISFESFAFVVCRLIVLLTNMSFQTVADYAHCFFSLVCCIFVLLVLSTAVSLCFHLGGACSCGAPAGAVQRSEADSRQHRPQHGPQANLICFFHSVFLVGGSCAQWLFSVESGFRWVVI